MSESDTGISFGEDEPVVLDLGVAGRLEVRAENAGDVGFGRPGIGECNYSSDVAQGALLGEVIVSRLRHGRGEGCAHRLIIFEWLSHQARSKVLNDADGRRRVSPSSTAGVGDDRAGARRVTFGPTARRSTL